MRCVNYSAANMSFLCDKLTVIFYFKANDYPYRCSYDFSDVKWQNISSEAQHFVTSLIEIDPAVRLTAPQALNHRWILSGKQKLSRRSERVECDIHDSLLKCAENTCLKKTALMFVAHKSSTAEIRDLRDIFFKYDEDGDGCVTYREFWKAMKEFDYSDEEIKYMFREVVSLVSEKFVIL